MCVCVCVCVCVCLHTIVHSQYMETQQLVMAAIANWYRRSDTSLEQNQKLSKIVDIAHDLKVNILHKHAHSYIVTHLISDYL